MRFSTVILSAALLAAAGLAQAQTSTTTPAAPAATPAPMAPAAAAKPATKATMTDDMKAKAKQCSDEADAKHLHGKARKKFRSECKKGA